MVRKWSDFPLDEVYFLHAIADLGAIAIENAKLYESVKRGYDEVRQDLLEWHATWGLERTVEASAGTEELYQAHLAEAQPD